MSMYDIDIDTTDIQALSRDEIRQGIERSMFTQVQLNELGLDTVEKIQAVLRGDDPSVHINPASVQASGNILTLTPDEEKLIIRRREKMEAEKTPTIDVSSAIVGDDDDEDDDDSGEALTSPYDAEGITNNHLRAELVRRELPVDGVKADLIARLEEDDKVKAQA